MRYLVIISILLFNLCACQTTPQFSDNMKQKILDDIKRDDITGRMHMLFRGIDNQNWQEVSEVLADEVEFDNNGSGSKKMNAAKVVDLWKAAVKGYQTHHQVSNYGIIVTNRHAKLMFVGTKTLFKQQKSKSNSKTHYGSYEVEMVQPEGDDTNWKWIITSFKYKNQFTIDK